MIPNWHILITRNPGRMNWIAGILFLITVMSWTTMTISIFKDSTTMSSPNKGKAEKREVKALHGSLQTTYKPEKKEVKAQVKMLDTAQKKNIKKLKYDDNDIYIPHTLLCSIYTS
jgi:hypothetical protein